MDEQPFPPDGWRVGLRVWIERAGQAVLGNGRLQLLESIDRCHSISAAARERGMSYRHAWELVQSVNAAAGEPLVTAATGGVHGGGAQLTPLGRWAIALFRELQGHLGNTASALLPQLLERAGTDDLHVAAAVSLEDVLGRLLNDYAARQPEIRVRVVFGASDELAAHLLAGAPGDLFLTADPRQLDRLENARLLLPGSRTALAGNSLAVIGATALALSIRKPTDLARAAVSRIALAAAACPLGDYTRAYLDSLHLYEPLLRRAVWVENSRAVVTAVRAGQADVGFVYSSDAVCAEGCRTLFRVRRTPVPICYAGAVLCRGADPAAALSLLHFLTSASAARRFRQCGFPPARTDSHSK
jgi:molybdenum ABC transporter molybdate-binding protein